MKKPPQRLVEAAFLIKILRGQIIETQYLAECEWLLEKL